MIYLVKIMDILRSKKGFSLIELSVVIVILSLLIGGVVTGATLIERAKLQNVLQEFRQLSFAVTNFKMQYNSLPGDMSNASSVLGTHSSCDGSGNGYIDAAASGNDEIVCAWVHLSAANLLTGGLSGDYPDFGGNTPLFIAANAAGLPVLGVNVPKSKWTGAGYMFRNVGSSYTYIFLGKPSAQNEINASFTSKQASAVTKVTGPASGGEGGSLLAINGDNAAGGTSATSCFTVTGDYTNLTGANAADTNCALGQQILD